MMGRSRSTGFCRGNRKHTIIAVLLFIVTGYASPLFASGTQASGVPEAGAPDITESQQTSEATSSQDVSDTIAIFSDDFEAFGDSSLWNRGESFPVQSEYVANGTHAARLNNQGGNPDYGRKSLNGAHDRLFVRIRFQVLELGSHPSTLVNLRATPTSSVLALRIDADGAISYVVGATGSVSESTVTSAANTWHELQVYLDASTDRGTVRLWLDQTELTSMRQHVWMGSSVVRLVDLGDKSAGQQSDVVFDDFVVDDEVIPSNRPADPVPGVLTIHTFPAWENIGFELDGEMFYSDTDGIATVLVSRWSTDLRSRISVTASSRSDGSQASFTGARIASSPTVAIRAFYVGIDDGNLYGIDASTSKERWSYDSGGPIFVSPDFGGDLVNATNPNGSVFAVDRASGKFRWNVRIGSAVYSTPAVVDGHVFVDGSDGRIYAFDDPNDQMAATWKCDRFIGSHRGVDALHASRFRHH